MHSFSRTILHHFCASYNHFLKFQRKGINISRQDWQNTPILPGNVKKVLNKQAASDRKFHVFGSADP
jgi:hypothetical protein